MSTSPHTPGPITLTSMGMLVAGPPDPRSTIRIASITRCYLASEMNNSGVPDGTPEGNGLLLAAAYTSYDRQCGTDALACAQDDLLGKAIDTLAELVEISGTDEWGSGGRVIDALNDAKDILRACGRAQAEGASRK